MGGTATCFQIATPTEVNCFDIGTPTIKIQDEDVDECFECEDSDDDCSQISESDCESEAETEVSSRSVPTTIAQDKKLSWNEVAERSARVCSLSPSVVQSQEPNWKLEASCHNADNRGFDSGMDSDC